MRQEDPSVYTLEREGPGSAGRVVGGQFRYSSQSPADPLQTLALVL